MPDFNHLEPPLKITNPGAVGRGFIEYPKTLYKWSGLNDQGYALSNLTMAASDAEDEARKVADGWSVSYVSVEPAAKKAKAAH